MAMKKKTLKAKIDTKTPRLQEADALIAQCDATMRYQALAVSGINLIDRFKLEDEARSCITQKRTVYYGT